MTDLERAKAFFAKDTFATEVTGIEIAEVAKGYAKCRLPIEDKHKNAVGAVMGGVLFTLADFTFAVAANFDADAVTVTLATQIQYLSPAKGDLLFAQSRLLKNGRHNCFYEITVTDNCGTTVAIASVTGAHI